jgi:hypothetical protein
MMPALLADTTELFTEEMFRSPVMFVHPFDLAIFYGQLVLILLGIGAVLGFIYSAIFQYRMNIPLAFVQTLRGLGEGLLELVLLPLGVRRVWAVIKLTVKECIRRRILYVFVLFLIPFLFAGWYLPNRDEGRLISLVGFVNAAITWLLMPAAIFLSSMSIPNDMQSRIIQTIATKPIRRLEFLVGKVIGFGAVFTGLLLLMGAVSLPFIYLQISEEVRKNQWLARVPVFATRHPEFQQPLVFWTRGQALSDGVNVGKEYARRKHVPGGSPDHAIYYFNYDPSQFRNREQVEVEMRLDIFKTNKGNPYRKGAEGSGVFAKVVFEDYETKQVLHQVNFPVNNYRLNVVPVPGSKFTSGQMVVRVFCLTPGQFVGMYDYDVYLLADNASFEANFAKGLLGVWYKLMIIITVGVCASTVLKGFVTVLLVTMVLVVGSNLAFFFDVAVGKVQGGGPLESLVRLVTQNNQVVALEENLINRAIVLPIDNGIKRGMVALWFVLPNLSVFDSMQWVASGFDIGFVRVYQCGTSGFGYIIPVIVLGHFLLRNRELAV